jgi:hypothetical protein
MSRPMTNNRATPLGRTLLSQRVLLAFVLVFTYGGGWWLWLLHEIEGAQEPGAPPGLLHWLRDSTLSLPLVGLGVLLGAALARRLLARYGQGASDLMLGMLVAMVMALYASVVLSVGNPVHGYLFGSTHGGHDLPLVYHVMRDGLLALSADHVLAVAVVSILLGHRWLAAARRPRLSSAAPA